MTLLFTVIVTFFAGMGAGLGTGFAGMSAAAVISPMLITFLHMDPYMAVVSTNERCVRLHLRQKQKSRCEKRPSDDGLRAYVHRGRQLHRQPAALSDNGQLFRVYDLPARRKIHRPSGYDH